MQLEIVGLEFPKEWIPPPFPSAPDEGYKPLVAVTSAIRTSPASRHRMTRARYSASRIVFSGPASPRSDTPGRTSIIDSPKLAPPVPWVVQEYVPAASKTSSPGWAAFIAA